MFEWFNPLYLKDKANGFTTDEYVKVSELHCYVRLDVSRVLLCLLNFGYYFCGNKPPSAQNTQI